jgi:hypothetical protein
VFEQGGHDGPMSQLQADRDRGTVEAFPQLRRPCLNGFGRMLEDGERASVVPRHPEADVVLLVCPVDPDESGERRWGHLVHVKTSRRFGVQDMHSRAQRRQYGEPVVRLSLSVRYGHRHTHRRERKLEIIACSRLDIRRRWVHVPHSRIALASKRGKRHGPPVEGLELTSGRALAVCV